MKRPGRLQGPSPPQEACSDKIGTARGCGVGGQTPILRVGFLSGSFTAPGELRPFGEAPEAELKRVLSLSLSAG